MDFSTHEPLPFGVMELLQGGSPADHTVRESVPENLDAVLLRAVSRERNERYSSSVPTTSVRPARPNTGTSTPTEGSERSNGTTTAPSGRSTRHQTAS